LIEELTGTVRDPDSYVDWKTALAMFVAKARSPTPTWSRPSRRFPDRPFEMPGRTYRPHRADEPCLLAAVDTSLSMTLPELEEVGRHLALVNQRARLLIAECDVEITRIYPFGGALERVTVIYFTDGEGPYPEAPPPVPTLWVLTKPQAFTCPWGERAYFGTWASRH
jgi:predicted metal-dependent peptidase